MKTMPAPSSASANDDVTTSPSGSRMPGRYFSFSRVSRMDAASSGERTHSEAGLAAPTMRRHRRPPRPGTDHCHPLAHATRDYGGPARPVCVAPTLSRCRGPPCRQRGMRSGAGRRPAGARGRPDPGQGLPPGQAAARVRPGRSASGCSSSAPWPTHVVAACAPLPVAVVCDDEDVARVGDGPGRHRHVGARTGSQRCRPGGRRPSGPRRRAVGDRRPRRPAPGPRPGRARRRSTV